MATEVGAFDMHFLRWRDTGQRTLLRQLRAGSHGVEYAGFWIRLGAYLIDAIILGIAGAVLGAVLGGPGSVLALAGTILSHVVVKGSYMAQAPGTGFGQYRHPTEWSQ